MLLNKELVMKVLDWSDARGILNGKIETQQMKFMSELGEFCDAFIKEDKEAMIDAIGDMCVVAINGMKLTRPMISKEDYTRDLLHELGRFETYYYPTYRKKLHKFTTLDTVSFLGNVFLRTPTREIVFHALNNLAIDVGLPLNRCLELAYDVIKDRKGKTLANGNFVKDTQ